jgi:hypothetical protein
MSGPAKNNWTGQGGMESDIVSILDTSVNLGPAELVTEKALFRLEKTDLPTKKAGDKHVGIDNHPDHLASRSPNSFSCRCAAISALISSGVIASSPRRLAPAQAFVSQSGRRRCRADEVLDTHDDDDRFAAPVDCGVFLSSVRLLRTP